MALIRAAIGATVVVAVGGTGWAIWKISKKDDPPATPPPDDPPKEDADKLETEWRDSNIDWPGASQKADELRKKVKGYKPCGGTEIKEVNILVVGHVGHGKSSFFNSVDTALKHCGDISAAAGAGEGPQGESFTTKLRKRHVRLDGYVLKFTLWDIMGIERLGDAIMMDIPNLLKGHIQGNYQFSMERPISEKDPSYIKNPTVGDRVHVILFVFDGMKFAPNPEIPKILQEIRKEAEDQDVPVIAVMTKVDEISELACDDLAMVYRCKKIEKVMKDMGNQTSIPLSQVYPIKNYTGEITPDDKVDVLILSALYRLLMGANSFIETQLDLDLDRNRQTRKVLVPI